jgi:hypothetical protein
MEHFSTSRLLLEYLLLPPRFADAFEDAAFKPGFKSPNFEPGLCSSFFL